MRKTLENELRAHGLIVLGVLDREEGGQCILVGNAGSAHWPSFLASAEFLDGLPHPMDRWSRRIGRDLASELNARAVFPFEGPPYAPFLGCLNKSKEAEISPIYLYFHRKYGLWHAYRFALISEKEVYKKPGEVSDISVCDRCQSQDCLASCPVSAFEPGTYRVSECVSFLRENPDSACRREGCAARKSCPHFRQYHYLPEHAQFHMTAFLKSQAP